MGAAQTRSRGDFLYCYTQHDRQDGTQSLQTQGEGKWETHIISKVGV